MGVKKLKSSITKIFGYVPLNGHIEDLRNSKVAIDTNNIIYNYIALGYYGRYTFLYSFIQMLILFRKHNIFPVFIFDGTPDPMKESEIETRKEKYSAIERAMKEAINPLDIERYRKQLIKPGSRDYDALKDLLNLFGVCYDTVHERDGEAFCCYLAQEGYVDYVISNDSDILVYNGIRWISDFSISGTFKLYEIEKVKAAMNRDYKTGIYSPHYGFEDQRKIIFYAIMNGTDFNIARRGNGPKTVYNKIKELSPDQIEKVYMPEYPQYRELLDRFLLSRQSTSSRYFDQYILRFARLRRETSAELWNRAAAAIDWPALEHFFLEHFDEKIVSSSIIPAAQKIAS